jgi:hypothetical protein
VDGGLVNQVRAILPDEGGAFWVGGQFSQVGAGVANAAQFASVSGAEVSSATLQSIIPPIVRDHAVDQVHAGGMPPAHQRRGAVRRALGDRAIASARGSCHCRAGLVRAVAEAGE